MQNPTIYAIGAAMLGLCLLVPSGAATDVETSGTPVKVCFDLDQTCSYKDCLATVGTQAWDPIVGFVCGSVAPIEGEVNSVVKICYSTSQTCSVKNCVATVGTQAWNPIVGFVCNP